MPNYEILIKKNETAGMTGWFKNNKLTNFYYILTYLRLIIKLYSE